MSKREKYMKKNNRVRNLAISTVVISLLATISIGSINRNNNKSYKMRMNTQKEVNYDDLKITEAIHYKDGKIVFLTNVNDLENDQNYIPFVEENIDLIDYVEVYGNSKDEKEILSAEEYKSSKTNEVDKTKTLKK